MIRAADDLGYDGQKIGKLAMTRIGEKQGRDLREQLGVKTMKDTVDVVMLANRFFDIEITLTETKEGEYVHETQATTMGFEPNDGKPCKQNFGRQVFAATVSRAPGSGAAQALAGSTTTMPTRVARTACMPR